MKAMGHIWIENGNGFRLGKGRAELLEMIAQTGSISQAAYNLDISYRKAWAMIKQMNESAPRALVKKTVGGKNGGGAIVTEYGKEVLKLFHHLHAQFNEFKQDFTQKLES
ncbi:MAG: winged helix-turn-helix domain-containing protein [Candidatus Competibacteraceae bacterium]|nr:winged helix-turn-helix domain-containing protein [Candidatus Competibacteraceae bacterium]